MPVRIAGGLSIVIFPPPRRHGEPNPNHWSLHCCMSEQWKAEVPKIDAASPTACLEEINYCSKRFFKTYRHTITSNHASPTLVHMHTYY